MTKKKKIALLTLPLLAFVVMSSSAASAYAMAGSDTLTTEQESALEEARELRKHGEGDEARKVLKQAGVSGFMRGHHGFSHSKKDTSGDRNAIRAALDANDFTAFKNATAGAPFATLVTEESFAKLIEAHTLFLNGDKEGAQKILQDLGFPSKHAGFGKSGSGKGGKHHFSR